MPRDILKDKKLIALAVEDVVNKTKGVSLARGAVKLGASYPFRPDVPGVWVSGPDNEGRYTVNVHIAVAGMRIPEAAEKLRSGIWGELSARELAELIKTVDIYVEDLMIAV